MSSPEPYFRIKIGRRYVQWQQHGQGHNSRITWTVVGNKKDATRDTRDRTRRAMRVVEKTACHADLIIQEVEPPVKRTSPPKKAPAIPRGFHLWTPTWQKAWLQQNGRGDIAATIRGGA